VLLQILRTAGTGAGAIQRLAAGAPAAQQPGGGQIRTGVMAGGSGTPTDFLIGFFSPGEKVKIPILLNPKALPALDAGKGGVRGSCPPRRPLHRQLCWFSERRMRRKARATFYQSGT